MRRVLWIVVVLLVVVAPVLDLAWNEPTLDHRPATRCPLHANPTLAPEPVCVALVRTVEQLLPFEPCDHLPLFGPSIFIPPRA